MGIYSYAISLRLMNVALICLLSIVFMQIVRVFLLLSANPCWERYVINGGVR